MPANSTRMNIPQPNKAQRMELLQLDQAKDDCVRKLAEIYRREREIWASVKYEPMNVHFHDHSVALVKLTPFEALGITHQRTKL